MAGFGGSGLFSWLWSLFLAHDHSGGLRGAALGGGVPAGAVMVWTGPASTIPAGWARATEADGRFLLAASSAGDHGALGGADSYDTTHAHGAGSLTTDGAGAHAHGVTTGPNTGGAHGSATGATTVVRHAHAHQFTTPSAGGAAHVISGASASAGGATDHRPPYATYYLIYRTS